MSDKKNSDISLKDLGKTFPWEGVIACVFTGVPFLRALFFDVIRLENTKFEGSQTIYLAENPADFWVLFAILLFCFVLCVAYTGFRLVYRAKLKKDERV